MLKELLKDLWTPEIEKALKGKEFIDKSEIKENYVTKETFKERLKEETDAKKNLAKEVKKYQDDIKKFSTDNTDIEEIKKQLELKTKEFTEYQEGVVLAELNGKKSAAIIKELGEMKALNPKLLAKEFKLDQVSFDDNGKLVGVKETFERLKTEYAPQFGKETVTTAKPGEGGGSGITKEAFSKMTYKERVELQTTNPTTYDTLAK